MDLRERIVTACAGCSSQVAVAHRFGVCAKTVQRYVARAATGELAARPHPGKAPRLRAEQEAAFVAMVEEKGDWTHPTSIPSNWRGVGSKISFALGHHEMTPQESETFSAPPDFCHHKP